MDGNSAFGDQFVESMSEVCGRLRGDAIIAAQEVGFDNLRETIDGRPYCIETLISHMRETVFPSIEYELERLFSKHCGSEGPLSKKNGESMEQYVSRRRRSWTLMTQTDPIIHPNVRHRPDMFLDLSGLTRKRRVEEQASIDHESDFDKVADALATYTCSSSVKSEAPERRTQRSASASRSK